MVCSFSLGKSAAAGLKIKRRSVFFSLEEWSAAEYSSSRPRRRRRFLSTADLDTFVLTTVPIRLSLRLFFLTFNKKYSVLAAAGVSRGNSATFRRSFFGIIKPPASSGRRFSASVALGALPACFSEPKSHGSWLFSSFLADKFWTYTQVISATLCFYARHYNISAPKFPAPRGYQQVIHRLS